MITTRLRAQAGFSLLEILLDVVILTLVSLAVSLGYRSISHKGVANKDKAFATQKAFQMVQEIQAASSTAGTDGVSVLNSFEDGTTDNQVLTVQKGIQDPKDPVSGNMDLRYVRRININPLDGDPNARRVSVKVYLASNHTLLAESLAVMRNPWKNYAPTQVFDVYLVSIEAMNFGWLNYGSMVPMKAMVGNVIQDLQSRKPGFEMRTHWITRLSYGRDPFYAPAINVALATNVSGALPWAYLYPGTLPQGGSYYDSNAINGRLLIDSALSSGPLRYSMSDAFNHALRYPDEIAAYNAAVAYASANGLPAPEISWRMLLEQMNSNPAGLQNMFLINLHGELLPLPAMHNYSDAAKDPAGYPTLRVVTHPENLTYAAASPVNLRVYSYVAGPTLGATSIVDATPEGTVISSMTVLLTNANVAGNVTVNYIVGDSSTAYTYRAANLGSEYSVSTVNGNQTLITLFNSPVRHARHAASQTGLPASARLYGMEYIPCPIGSSFGAGVNDLTVANSTAPKNTARWVIQIGAGANLSAGQYAVETRIGGISSSQPTNLSRTYFWVATTPPVTEQYQFMGDPRHMPYADVKANKGYNWYFLASGTATATGYAGYSKAQGPWLNTAAGVEHGNVVMDVPRYSQLLRTGILNTHAIFTNAGGHVAWWFGQGGDLAGDGSLLEVLSRPWKPQAASGATLQVDEAGSGYATQNYVRMLARSDKSWVSLPWLGELYPDDTYTASWSVSGNLPTGASGFYRAMPTDFPAYFSTLSTHYFGISGPASMINGSQDGISTFAQGAANTNKGNLMAPGLNIANALNISFATSMIAHRPYTLHDTNSYPAEWNDPVYQSMRVTLTSRKIYYDSNFGADYASAGLIQMAGPSGDIAEILPIGLYTGAQYITSQLAINALALTVRGFMDSGVPSLPGRMPQLPFVSLTSPAPGAVPFQNPSSIPISWTTQWLRWDGQLYTEDYAAGFAETTPPVYLVKYSPDSGHTWRFADDGSVASAGVMSATHAVTNSLTWNVSTLAAGTYLLRLEAYRPNSSQHYAYHQCALQIVR